MPQSRIAKKAAAPTRETGLSKLGEALARVARQPEGDGSGASVSSRSPRPAASASASPGPTNLGVRLAASSGNAQSSSAAPARNSTWGWKLATDSPQPEEVHDAHSRPSHKPEEVHDAHSRPTRNPDEEDSNTRTYEENGVTYQEQTQVGPDEEEIVVRTYEIDGVSYEETTTTRPNGDQSVVVDATQGDRTERTTTDIQEVDGDLEDYVGDELGSTHYDSEAERGPTTQVNTTTVVIDNSQDPPEEVLVHEAVSYSQQIRSNPEEILDGGFGELDSGINLGNPLPVLVEQEVDWNNQESGQTLTVTTQSTLDAEGNRVRTSSVNSEHRLVGVGEDGQEVVLSSSGNLVFNEDGDEIQYSYVHEERGNLPRSEADRILAANMHGDADEFGQRLVDGEGDYVNFRQSYTQNLESGEEVYVQELGDYDKPREDGRTVVSVSNGEVTSLSYRLVSDDGDRVQQQTVVPGTDYSSVSDTQYGDNGTFTSSTRTEVDGQVSESEASRELLYEEGESLPAAAPPGYTQEQWDEFRAEHPQGPVYRDQSSSESRDEDGNLVEGSSTSSHSAGSSTVGVIEQRTPDGEARANLLQIGGDDPHAAIVMDDGSEATIDEQGNILINGEPVEGAEPGSGAPGALVGLGSGAQGLSQLYGVLRMNQALADSVGATRLLGPLGAAVGFQGLLAAENGEQATSALGGLTGGVGSTLTAFGTGSRAARVATGLGRGLGAVGAGLTAGLGIYELTQGNYAEGAADIVAGGALVGAVILGATPAGWALAGLAGVATAVRFFLDIGDEDQPSHPPLEF